MSSITVRNIPERVKDGLVRRAKASGESLEALVRSILAKEAGFEKKEPWRDLVDRLADEARSLPPSDPEKFDPNIFIASRASGPQPPIFDWWPDEADEAGDGETQSPSDE